MTPNAASPNLVVDPETIRRMAALGGLHLTLEQAAGHAPALQELLSVDAAIAALPLDTVPAVGHPWGAWMNETDPRG